MFNRHSPNLNESANLSEPPPISNANESSNENPFAPTLAGNFAGGTPRVHLDAAYWIALAVMLVGILVMYQSFFPLRRAAVVLFVAAAIRVPLLQRRHHRSLSDDVPAMPALPSPLALLFSSLALNLVFLVVSFLTFMTVCIPGTIAFGLGDLNNTVFWISVLAGAVCFSCLVFLSLRLRF